MHDLRRGGARAAKVPGGPLPAADVVGFTCCCAASRRLHELHFTPRNSHQNLGTSGAQKAASTSRCYTNALEIDESHAPSVSNRGNCLRHLGKLQEAERDYQLAIEMDPSNAKSFANRGALLRQQGKNVRALDDFRR